MMNKRTNYMDPRNNVEGYPDPTPHDAIKEADAEYDRLKKVLDVIYSVCRLAGFRVEEHIVLKDMRTGRVYR